MSSNHDLGQDIRALRTSREMTLEVVARQLGKSVSWTSQGERDLSGPPMGDPRAIAALFDVPLPLFFGTAPATAEQQGVVVRASARRQIGAHDTGLVETLISPDLTDDFEMIHSTFQPGAAMATAMSRATTEVVCLLSGMLDLWIEDQLFTISAGDSFRIRGDSYRWANPYDVPAVAVWVISPPVY